MSREVKEYFEQVSPHWDELRPSFYGNEVRNAVIASARILPEHTVLDVGAGTGFLTEEAAQRARRVIALDFSESMLDAARTKLAGKNVEFRLGSAEEIPLPDASIDAVLGNMVLHHCPRPAVAVGEMVRVLVPGGGWSFLIFRNTVTSRCARNTQTFGLGSNHPMLGRFWNVRASTALR